MKSTRSEKPNKTTFGKILLRILAAFLIVVLLLLLVMYGVPMLEHADRTEVPGSTDWMAGLDGSLLLSELTIPGAHDAATANVGLPFFSRCQDRSVLDQLNDGVRYLDIRLGMDEAGLKLMHGFTNCKQGTLPWGAALRLETVLDQCYGFLRAHRGETVLFAVKQEHGSETAAAFAAALEAVIDRNPDLWYVGTTLPTLGEARGKLVLLRRYADGSLPEDAACYGVPLFWGSQRGSDDVSRNTVSVDQGSYTLWVQDRYEYGTDDKWAAFTAGLETAKADRENAAIHFLSTKGTLPYGHAYYFAYTLNARLAGLPEKDLSGWIVLDFCTAALARQIYRTNYR